MSSGNLTTTNHDLPVRRRPNLWSYFSFSPTTSRRPSVSTRNRAPTLDDPHEKPDRHLNGLPTGGLGSSHSTTSSTWMAQGQRSRILKVVVAIVCVVSLVFFLSPRTGRVSRYVGRECLRTQSSIIYRCWCLFDICRSSIEHRPDGVGPGHWLDEMHPLERYLETINSICAHDRRWQHGLAHPCIPVQQLWTDA